MNLSRHREMIGGKTDFLQQLYVQTNNGSESEEATTAPPQTRVPRYPCDLWHR